jgi:hypothetical protein
LSRIDAGVVDEDVDAPQRSAIASAAARACLRVADVDLAAAIVAPRRARAATTSRPPRARDRRT